MSLMTITADLLSATENLGGSPPEFRSYLDKLDEFVFAGITGLDLSTISSDEFETIKDELETKLTPGEVIAYLEKFEQAIITPEEE